MTTEQRRGRVVSLAIGSVIAIINLVNVLLAIPLGDRPGWMDWAQLAIALAIAWCLYRGYSSARAYLALSLGAIGLLALLLPLFALKTPIEIKIKITITITITIKIKRPQLYSTLRCLFPSVPR